MAESSGVKVEILSITIDSKITACLGGTPVKLPNWEPGVGLNESDGLRDLASLHGSKRAGVFKIVENGNEQSEVDDKKRNKLIVEVNVTKPKAFKKATLTGKLGTLEFTGTIIGRDTSNSPQIVELFAKEEPTVFTRIGGDMEWYLSYEDYETVKCVKPEKTRLEIFWIYGYPGQMYKKGVWIEVLRLLDIVCGGLKDKKSVVRRIVNYCHSETGVRYDSYIFTSYYGLISNGGAFSLKAYLEKVHSFCNCFDQTGAVQTLLGALGLEVLWALMSPFGYLRQTNLVGRGTCNNPGFLATLNLPSPKMQPEVLRREDPNRIPFVSHSFCIWKHKGSDVFLDTSAGPHYSYDIKKTFVDSNGEAYIDVNIDTNTGLYLTGPYLEEPGNLEDIDENCEGVIDIDGITDSPIEDDLNISTREKEKIEEFMRDVEFHEAGRGLALDEGVVCDWSNPFDPLCMRDLSWVRKFEGIRNSIDTVVKEWYLIGANEYIGAEIYVAKHFKSARNRLINLALSTTMPKVPFKKKPQPLGHLHLHWYSPYYMIEYWWYFNICIKITAFNPSIDLADLAKELHKQATDNVVKNLPDWFPVIEKVQITSPSGKPFSGKINVGEKVNIKVSPKSEKDRDSLDVLMLDFFFTKGVGLGEHLRLIEESATVNDTNSNKIKIFELTFEGRSPGITEVQLVLVNQKNLLCSDPWGVTINVTRK